MEKSKCGINASKAKKRPFSRLAARLKEKAKRIRARMHKLGLGFPDIIDSVPDKRGRMMKSTDARLVRAAIDGDVAKMEKLIRKGVSVNTMIPLGKASAPLIHFCAINDAYPQLSLLLDNGADPDIKDARGMTALMHAAGHSSYEVCCVLLADMLTKDKDINAADDEGMTTLMHAAAHAKDDACALFLLQGAADPYVKAKDGRTAYIFARNRMTKKAISRNALGRALVSPFLEQMLGKQLVSFKANFVMCVSKG